MTYCEILLFHETAQAPQNIVRNPTFSSFLDTPNILHRHNIRFTPPDEDFSPSLVLQVIFFIL
jgi:hypothetical protein